MTGLSLPLPCIRLLPHRETMLLAGDLIEYQPGRARIVAPLAADGLFVNARGVLDPVAIIEVAAQASAAFKGYEALLRGEPVRIGYLVGIKDFSIEGKASAGETLEAAVELDFAMEQAALMTARVSRGGNLIGMGTIKIWEERDWPAVPPAGDATTCLPGLEHPATMGACVGADPLGRALIGTLEGVERSAAANQVAGWFRFGENFTGFHGHFPRFPILPAVVMPRLATLLAGTRTGQSLKVRRVEQAKIGQGIFPNEPVRVEVMMESMKLKAKFTGPRGLIASFSLECSETGSS